MISLTNKKYFLFDMDGTLVDLEVLNYECFKSASLELLHRDMSFEEYTKYVSGTGSKQGLSDYLQAFGFEKTLLEPLINAYRERKDFMLKTKFDEVVSVKRGLPDFLVEVRKRGGKLAVATSTVRKFALYILERSGLTAYFDEIVTVEDAPKTKPAPDIFFEALSRLQGEKAEAVIFEDSPNGVQSAINTGIDYIVIRNPGKNDSVAGTSANVITDYNELLNAV